MDLANVFQVILFILPGFLAVQVFFLVIPSRRNAGDAEVVVTSIFLSALLWIAASAVLLGLEGIINGGGHFFGRGPVDLWNDWIHPALTLERVAGSDLVPGLVMNLLGIAGGIVVARSMLHSGGRVRVFSILGLKIDLNARLFGWFLQEPEGAEAPPLAPKRGRFFRVRLKSGEVLVGQIGQYSSDPNDDLQEVVLRRYSRVVDGRYEPVSDSHGALIARADIDLIEILNVPSEGPPHHLAV